MKSIFGDHNFMLLGFFILVAHFAGKLDEPFIRFSTAVAKKYFSWSDFFDQTLG